MSVLRVKDITNLVELAKRLRPDTALLAVMENDEKLGVPERSWKRLGSASNCSHFAKATLKMVLIFTSSRARRIAFVRDECRTSLFHGATPGAIMDWAP
jgi:hypothetical protein